MSKERTYSDYKYFFEEVNKANKLEFYQYSFTLLFSFLEDRINKIYSEQYWGSTAVLNETGDGVVKVGMNYEG